MNLRKINEVEPHTDAIATLESAVPKESPHVKASIYSGYSEPSQREILVLFCFSSLVFVASVSAFTNFFLVVDNFGDSSAYMSVASAIRHWSFHGVVVKQFWGLPYATAAVSALTGISDRAALLVVSEISSLVSVLLAHRLWGGWVAGFFAVLNFDWMQRSFLGGSEPLFVALLFAGFWMTRRQRWIPAAALFSLATTVRPLGLCALIGMGLILLWRRRYGLLAADTILSVAIGVAYALPLRAQFGDALATVHSYQQTDPSGPALFGLPFLAIIKGTLLYPAPWTNLLFTFGWILITLAGVLVMLTTVRFREFARTHPVEAGFAALYLLFIFSYNYPYWARGSFPRFVIPAIPILTIALLRWVPRSRPLLWCLGTISPALAAFSAIGIRNVIRFMPI